MSREVNESTHLEKILSNDEQTSYNLIELLIDRGMKIEY